MKTRTVLGVIITICALGQAVSAQGKEDIQKYFSDTACKVKVTNDPVQKREILDKSLQTMSQALERVEKSGLISEDERAGMDHFKTTLKEKQDELAGINGFDRVTDAQLNDFSDYVVQDMEQAARTVTVSLISALLIIIILVLIL